MTIEKLLIGIVAAMPICLLVFVVWQARKAEREYFTDLLDDKEYEQDSK